MYKIILCCLLLATLQPAHAQYKFTTTVKDKISQKPLVGVNVTILNFETITTNADGYAELAHSISDKRLVTWSYSGYGTITDTIDFSLDSVISVRKEMEPENDELEEVVVQSTRTGRTISNTPTRIETIDGEELDEKNNMRPANVSMLLHESTGIQVQQTSATSANASIRIQGLDGRYSQLLKDGYANFGNFANGLSVLEIPPLDLKQVEVIKGPASTLYGGGAIAGVVNFISKTPEEQFSGDIMLNHSGIGQNNIGGYFSQRGKKIGFAVLGLVNFQKAYDVDKDDFSELPKSANFTINPRLFFYPNETMQLTLGNSLTSGNSIGGDMHIINNNPSPSHIYFEKNTTLRNTSTFELFKTFSDGSDFKIKQSLTFFNRNIEIPGYQFLGKNVNSFTDISYLFSPANHTMIGGANIIYDRFTQPITATYNNHSTTGGLYFQDTWDALSWLKLETGLRADYANYQNSNFEKNQFFLLPRISGLVKWNSKLTSRLGGGLGYKLPTIFNERTESMQYRGVAALSDVQAEKSRGATADINYRTQIGALFSLSVNQMFYYTVIHKPLVLEEISEDDFVFRNEQKPVTTRGFETNVRLVFDENLKLFAGYTFTDAKATYLQQNQVLPLMPRHKLNAVLMYEKEDDFKLGIEGYHTGTQYLYNGLRTPSFWEFGFMAQKTFGKLTVFINFENFTDQRQSRYKRVVSGNIDDPQFDDIWNHTEGRVINGGIKIKW